jgi:ATP-dependent helicase Lhr and Lhr-like helicase
MTAQVVPSDHFGNSRWLGGSQPLSQEMCQAIRRTLLGGGPAERWSKRARAEMSQTIEETNCVAPDALVVEVDGDKDRTTWWTFAGLLANSQLAGAFASSGGRPDNLSITINRAAHPQDFKSQLKSGLGWPEPAKVDNDDLVKFHQCLPERLLSQIHASRSSDPQAVEASKVAKLLFRDMK